MRKIMLSRLSRGTLTISGFALFILVAGHVLATPDTIGGDDVQTKDRASKPALSAVSLEKSVFIQLEGEPEGPAFWDTVEPGAKIAAGANANAVLSLDWIADGGSGNQRDDGVTSGTVSGRGATIAVEVFATGVRTSVSGYKVEFDFDASLLAFRTAEGSVIPRLGLEDDRSVSFGGLRLVTLAPSGFLARAEFETVADVTGREFTIGIVRVLMVGGTSVRDAVTDTLTTVSAIRFNTNPSPDFDGDGTVGFSDFVALASVFGSQQGDAKFDARFDLNGDGSIGFSDFVAFAADFGKAVEPPPSGSPDLIVESPSVNDNTLTTGQSFTFRATVRNQGNASSSATTLRYYRSSNATVSTNDTEVGTDAVSNLQAGGASAESISLDAPSSAGTYYYGACVDAVSGESNTGNNCSAGVSVTVSSGGGGGTSNLGACRVGLVVRPNQSCTVSSGAFINIGSGCFNYTPFGSGSFCSGSFNLNGFQGTRVGNDFRITAVP